MPTFTFTSPDGKDYSVDGPEGATATQAFQILQRHLGVAPSEGSSVGGVGKSLVSGVIGGTADMLQGGVDLANAGLGKLTGIEAPAVPSLRDTAGAVTGGSLYKPQGGIERAAYTTGEFLPAVIGGPEGLATKLATRVAAPALASEGAGALTQGTAAEPYARAAGALLGGTGGALAANRLARPAAAAVPAADDILKAGSRGFENVKNSGATIDPNDAAIMAQGIKAKIFKEGARPASQPALFSELDRLEELGKAGAPLSMNDMESVRKAINDLKMSPDGAMRTHAKTAVNEFMSQQTQVLPSAVSSELKDAIANWAAGKRSNTVMGKAALADLNAATAGSGANIDNASRQAVKQLIRPINNDIVPKAARMGFNQEEIAAMNNVARGTLTGNVARYIGKGAPTGIVTAAGGLGIGHMAGGPVGAVALPVVGMIAKKIGDLSTKKGIAALDSLVRSRSPLAAQVAAQHPQLVQYLSPATTKLLAGLSVGQAIAPRPQPIIAGSN